MQRLVNARMNAWMNAWNNARICPMVSKLTINKNHFQMAVRSHHWPEIWMIQDVAVVVHSEAVAIHTKLGLKFLFISDVSVLVR